MEEEDAVLIDIDGALATSIQRKLRSLKREPNEKSPLCIFRVPAHVRESNKNYYEPRIVSIGPYHRGSKHLRAMEDHKWLYLQDFLSRDPENSLQTYVDELKALEPSARRFYFESVDMENDEFTKMMLLDGCFILEFLLKWYYGPHDSVFDVDWSIYLIAVDLLMLENQIPFFVLERLYHLQKAPDGSSTDLIDDVDSPSLVDLLVNYLMNGDVASPISITAGEIHHLLHLYYYCIVPDQKLPSKSSKMYNFLLQLRSFIQRMTCRSPPSSNTRAPRMIPCATELQESGVTFKRKKPDILFDITFDDGLLEIPYLAIQESTKYSFMNLIAFEQCIERKKRYLTSYAAFMDCIINTGKDVAILQRSGIIENKLASEEEVAIFFNHLRDGSYIDYEDHYHVGTFRAVEDYYKSRWHRYRARMCHDYFRNPWSILSLLAAVALLLLTLTQTVFSILAYVQPPS
ncbi:UPF0481 protein At3g47200-like [Typha angustifolia]|uniref:UPF0481 protein At3g47200-like n=1 Tax=Typha angustifolia TaxID=59011 RepID=UPI003C30632F